MLGLVFNGEKWKFWGKMSATGCQGDKRWKKEAGGRRQEEQRQEEGRGSQEVEGNFFLWCFCLSCFVIWHILYLSMHLHDLASVVMLNLWSYKYT